MSSSRARWWTAEYDTGAVEQYNAREPLGVLLPDAPKPSPPSPVSDRPQRSLSDASTPCQQGGQTGDAGTELGSYRLREARGVDGPGSVATRTDDPLAPLARSNTNAPSPCPDEDGPLPVDRNGSLYGLITCSSCSLRSAIESSGELGATILNALATIIPSDSKDDTTPIMCHDADTGVSSPPLLGSKCAVKLQ